MKLRQLHSPLPWRHVCLPQEGLSLRLQNLCIATLQGQPAGHHITKNLAVFSVLASSIAVQLLKAYNELRGSLDYEASARLCQSEAPDGG